MELLVVSLFISLLPFTILITVIIWTNDRTNQRLDRLWEEMSKIHQSLIHNR